MKTTISMLTTAVCLFVLLFSACSPKEQWKPLFGENLSDATFNPAVWTLEDGVLSAVEDDFIWTKTEYENFELDLEFKTDEGTNSGVVVYCSDLSNWVANSVEVQIADDHSAVWGLENSYQKCGAIYGHLPPVEQKIVNKPGEWNRMQVTCRGQHIVVVLNGREVSNMDMSQWTSGTENPDGTTIPPWLPKPFAELPTKGYIGLQGKHGQALIWFRNLNIRSL